MYERVRPRHRERLKRLTRTKRGENVEMHDGNVEMHDGNADA